MTPSPGESSGNNTHVHTSTAICTSWLLCFSALTCWELRSWMFKTQYEGNGHGKSWEFIPGIFGGERKHVWKQQLWNNGFVSPAVNSNIVYNHTTSHHWSYLKHDDWRGTSWKTSCCQFPTTLTLKVATVKQRSKPLWHSIILIRSQGSLQWLINAYAAG